MKRLLLLFLLLIGMSGMAWAVTCNTPSSSYTYVSGQTILPNQVQTNENNLYTYDQQGVCNYQAGSITQAAVSSTAGILYSQLNLSGGLLPTDMNTTTTTSVYTFQNVTVPYATTLSGTNTISTTTQFGSLNGLLAQTTGSIYVPTIGAGLSFTGGTLSSNITYVKVSERESQNTGAGASVSGAWYTRVLNTTDNDTNSISSLSSNQVTLPAGTYIVHALSPIQYSGTSQLRLQDITAGTTLILGQSWYYSNSPGIIQPLEGAFTLTASHALALQYYCTSGNGTGLGYPANITTEVYTVIEFWKIS